MIIGARRDGSQITLNSPYALLVFKTYGNPLASGLVQIRVPGGTCVLHPDTGSVKVQTEINNKGMNMDMNMFMSTDRTKSLKSIYFKSMPEAAGKKCTITGDQTTGDNAIITEEGHVYSVNGLKLLFRGGRATARSPYPGAKPLVKSKYFSRED
jgi:hypothetical protein